MWSQSLCAFHSLPKWWWWWQWWDYGVGVCSLSTVSPHGLLPPLSFYSLLLGDAALSPNATQAKTPLSSFARARYPGNTAIPPLLFCTHLLSSLISPPPPILLSSAWVGHRFFCFWSMSMRWSCVSHSVELETQALGFEYDKFNLMCSSIIIVTFQSRSLHHPHFAVERMFIILNTMKSFGQLCWFIVKVRWPVHAVYRSLPNVIWCCQLHIFI